MQDSVLPRGVGLRKPHISSTSLPLNLPILSLSTCSLFLCVLCILWFPPLTYSLFSVWSVFSMDSLTLAVLRVAPFSVFCVFCGFLPYAVLFLCFPYFVVSPPLGSPARRCQKERSSARSSGFSPW